MSIIDSLRGLVAALGPAPKGPPPTPEQLGKALIMSRVPPRTKEEWHAVTVALQAQVRELEKGP